MFTNDWIPLPEPAIAKKIFWVAMTHQCLTAEPIEDGLILEEDEIVLDEDSEDGVKKKKKKDPDADGEEDSDTDEEDANKNDEDGDEEEDEEEIM